VTLFAAQLFNFRTCLLSLSLVAISHSRVKDVSRANYFIVAGARNKLLHALICNNRNVLCAARMDAKLKIYPGVARGAVSFFYKDFELYQVADISMMRRDVIACFECREFSAPLQCQYKMFVIGTNNRGVN
jgi:hypothetical protein